MTIQIEPLPKKVESQFGNSYCHSQRSEEWQVKLGHDLQKQEQTQFRINLFASFRWPS